MKLEIGLFGNPNCGKTTLFNELTGGNRSVGNWTGTTVTLDIGHFHYKKQAIDLVDIPGIYSLFTHTPEQLTGCEYLLNYHPEDVYKRQAVTCAIFALIYLIVFKLTAKVYYRIVKW